MCLNKKNSIFLMVALSEPTYMFVICGRKNGKLGRKRGSYIESITPVTVKDGIWQ